MKKYIKVSPEGDSVNVEIVNMKNEETIGLLLATVTNMIENDLEDRFGEFIDVMELLDREIDVEDMVLEEIFKNLGGN